MGDAVGDLLAQSVVAFSADGFEHAPIPVVVIHKLEPPGKESKDRFRLSARG